MDLSQSDNSSSNSGLKKRVGKMEVKLDSIFNTLEKLVKHGVGIDQNPARRNRA